MNPSEFKTRDLYFSAYIIATGRRLVRSERGLRAMIFVFDAEAENLRIPWVDGSGTVSAQAYATAIRNLKSLIALEV